ncbi:MAG: hypothetical protein QXP34_01180 [Candidatus Aenigmatarchaeota archaeon]
MKDYEINEIKVKAFIAIGKGYSRFIKPKEVFRHIYGRVDGEIHQIVIKTDGGIFTLPILGRQDPFYLQGRTKFPEAIIVVNENGRPELKLVEFRIYNPYVIRYINNLINRKNNNIPLVSIPTQFLTNDLLYMLGTPKILWRSKPYNYNLPISYVTIIKFGHEIKQKPIFEYSDLKLANEQYKLFQLALLDLVPQTAITYIIFGENENDKIDMRDFNKNLFFNSLRELKVSEEEIRERSGIVAEKVMEKIFKTSCKPGDLGWYQISYDEKEDEIVFFDIASGIECINPNLSEKHTQKALQKLLFSAHYELDESLDILVENANSKEIKEKVSKIRKIVRKAIGKTFSEYYTESKKISNFERIYEFPSACIESAKRYLEKYKVSSN